MQKILVKELLTIKIIAVTIGYLIFALGYEGFTTSAKPSHEHLQHTLLFTAAILAVPIAVYFVRHLVIPLKRGLVSSVALLILLVFTLTNVIPAKVYASHHGGEDMSQAQDHLPCCLPATEVSTKPVVLAPDFAATKQVERYLSVSSSPSEKITNKSPPFTEDV